jgi:hypothetical protein
MKTSISNLRIYFIWVSVLLIFFQASSLAQEQNTGTVFFASKPEATLIKIQDTILDLSKTQLLVLPAGKYEFAAWSQNFLTQLDSVEVRAGKVSKKNVGMAALVPDFQTYLDKKNDRNQKMFQAYGLDFLIVGLHATATYYVLDRKGLNDARQKALDIKSFYENEVFPPEIIKLASKYEIAKTEYERKKRIVNLKTFIGVPTLITTMYLSYKIFQFQQNFIPEKPMYIPLEPFSDTEISFNAYPILTPDLKGVVVRFTF